MLEGDPAQAREVLARHVQPLVLTPTTDGYQVTGAFDLATVIQGAEAGASDNGSRRDPYSNYQNGDVWLPVEAVV